MAFTVLAAAALIVPTPVHAQCVECADLEERIAELEATTVRRNELLDVTRQLNEVSEQAAVGIALEDPELPNGDRYAVRMNLGTVEGENAVGVSAIGVVGHNVVSAGDTLAVSGAVGVGLDHEQVGGRVSGQLSWK